MNRRNLRLFILSSVFVLVVIASVTAFLLTKQPQVISFEQAQDNVELRDAYVKQMVVRIGKPDFTNVFYDPDQQSIIGHQPLMGISRPDNPSLQIDTGALLVNIRVFPRMFSHEYDGTIHAHTEETFRLSLWHEYHHAQQHRIAQVRGIPFSAFVTLSGKENKGIWLAVTEMDAFGMVNLPYHKNTNYRSGDDRSEYISFYKFLWLADDDMNLDFISALKVEFFYPGMFEVFTERMDGSYSWKSSSNAEYVLLKEEIARIKQRQD